MDGLRLMPEQEAIMMGQAAKWRYRRLRFEGSPVVDFALVTGFSGYGGKGRNPAGEIAAIFDGRSIAGFRVIGRVLPVSYRRLRADIAALLEEHRPRVLISLGLCPGEPMIRLERIAINVADFEIPDNDGAIVTDTPIDPLGLPAAMATLPLRDIESHLLQAGIPARISSTAGTFLCNAALYTALTLAKDTVSRVGFIHLPYVPEQVAEMLRPARGHDRYGSPQLGEVASMELSTMIRALEIALQVTAATIGQGGEIKAEDIARRVDIL
jgi:pyroglutamyl-peptidase